MSHIAISSAHATLYSCSQTSPVTFFHDLTNIHSDSHTPTQTETIRHRETAIQTDMFTKQALTVGWVVDSWVVLKL